MQAIVQQFFNLSIMGRALPLVLTGFWTTLLICLVVIPLGLSGGVLVAAISLSRSPSLRWATKVLVDLFRALPLQTTSVEGEFGALWNEHHYNYRRELALA